MVGPRDARVVGRRAQGASSAAAAAAVGNIALAPTVPLTKGGYAVQEATTQSLPCASGRLTEATRMTFVGSAGGASRGLS